VSAPLVETEQLLSPPTGLDSPGRLHLRRTGTQALPVLVVRPGPVPTICQASHVLLSARWAPGGVSRIESGALGTGGPEASLLMIDQTEGP
jgi:hypothetical protein